MNAATERALLRLLVGELPAREAEALSRRMAAEPELAAAYRRLADRWQGLELPPAAPAPVGFAARVTARARRLGRPQAGLSTAPVWVRATAALALALGLAVGAGLGLLETSRGEDGLAAWGSSMAEWYWEAVEIGMPAEGAGSDEVAR